MCQTQLRSKENYKNDMKEVDVGDWRTNDADRCPIFWTCQIIVSYWQEIHEHIHNVFGSTSRSDVTHGRNMNVQKYFWQRAKRLSRGNEESRKGKN